MRAPSQTIAKAVARHPWRVLLAWLGLTATLAWPALHVPKDFTVDDLFAGFEEDKRAAEQFKRTFGNTDNVVLMIVAADDVFAPAVLSYMHQAAAALGREAFVSRATSIVDMPFGPAVGDDVDGAEAAQVRRAAADTPLVQGKLVARDGTAAVVALMLDIEIDRNDEVRPAVEAIEAWVARHPPPPGVELTLGGRPYVQASIIRYLERDQAALIPATFAICLLILLVSFRWLPAMVLPLAAVALAGGLLMGGMGLFGEPLNIINNIVPLIIIIIGISDSIHLLNRYGEELAAGGTREQAVVRAVRAMTVACFLTSFTTAVGFASLAVSEMSMLRRFGVTAAIGILLAYVVTITFVPAALALVPSPRRPLADARHGRLERFAAPAMRAVLRLRWPVLGLSAAVLAMSAWAATRVPVDTSVLEQFDADDPVHRAIELYDDKLDGIHPIEVSLRSEPGGFDDAALLNELDALAAWARAQPGVQSATSYADFLHETWVRVARDPTRRSAPFDTDTRVPTLATLLAAGSAGVAGAYVTPDRGQARLEIRMGDVGAKRMVGFAAELRAELDRRLAGFAGVSARLTGDGYLGSRGLALITRDLLTSLLTAVAIIFAFMAVVFRSPRLAAIAVPPNVLPLLVTLAYMYLRDIPLNTGTVVTFSISLGLAVDGTIHILARFLEETRAGHDRDRALLAAAVGTGKAVIVSYLALIIGFAAFQLSAFVPIRRFGELVAMTIVGCLLATLIVLPALLRVAWREPARDSLGRRG